MIRLLLVVYIALISSVASLAKESTLNIVPYPESLVRGKGQFSFSERTVFGVENDEQAKIARCFADLFASSTGFSPRVEIGTTEANIVFTTNPAMKSEAYHLDITPSKIKIEASDGKGFFYAIQTIRQLLPSDLETTNGTNTTAMKVPAVVITDSPRFDYRGLMIDVARFFLPKESLLRIIDCASMLKLNKLHLHLADDNGWRLEIKRYPLLTEVGSRRVERPGQVFPDRRNARQGEPTVEKGFYTQEDIREIVAYAADRSIDVIPEIEMPAHSNAALAAYPLLACPVVDKYIGVLPGLGGDHADIIYCAGNDSVYAFLENVLDEVMEIFPSKYIHLGGDEAWKTHWKVCPLCQAKMKKEGLADEEALQGYFMARMSQYVQSKGREVIGWDELTNTTIPQDAIIFGWQGYGQAALKAAKLGHRFVMTPARVLYLIRYQGPQWFEPFTYFGNNTLKDVYSYEPVKEDWTPETESLLMGIQGSLWTEFCNSAREVEYMLFPRLAALAEGAWTAPSNKDWSRFLSAMDNYNSHIMTKGVNVARSMYNIQHKVTPKDGKLNISLLCERPDVEIRYTLDGKEPTATSTLYKNEIVLTGDKTVKAATFRKGKKMGEEIIIPIKWNMATAKPILTNSGGEVELLTNGLRGSVRYSDFEWYAPQSPDSASFVVDLQSINDVKTLTLGSVTNYGMAVHKPSVIEVLTSVDNENFEHQAEKRFTNEEIFVEDTFKEDISLYWKPVKARYIKVIVKGAGKCPANHLRPGQVSRYYFDELILN
jgi:hexosaminidase